LIDEPVGFTARLREVDEEIGLDGILAELNLRRPHPARPRAERTAPPMRGGKAALSWSRSPAAARA